MRKNVRRNIIAAILMSTVIANSAFAGATGIKAIDFNQSEAPGPMTPGNATNTGTTDETSLNDASSVNSEEEVVYQNPTGNTGWFKFGQSWFYYENGIAYRDRLSPDGYALNLNGIYVPSNIDHAKYAAESIGRQIIVFSKSAMRVELWTNGTMTGTWTATSGRNHGDKNVEGDCKTPEGRFYLAQKLPHSNYTRGLLVSYPNVEDAERGLTQGIISRSTYDQIVAANAAGITPPQNTALGGMIEFHGNGQQMNATHGCIGLKDHDIIELYNLVQPGAVIDILA